MSAPDIDTRETASGQEWQGRGGRAGRMLSEEQELLRKKLYEGEAGSL